MWVNTVILIDTIEVLVFRLVIDMDKREALGGTVELSTPVFC